MSTGLLEMIASYGAPSQSIAFSNDSFDMGFLCGQESTSLALFTWLAMPDLMTGMGNVGGAEVFSLATLALDAEAVQYLARLRRGLAVDDEEEVVAVIKSAGPGGNFLKEKHTLRVLRAGEQWIPDLSRRRGLDQVLAGQPDAVALARQRVEELLASHTPPPLPDRAAEAMDEALDDAARERGVPAVRITS